MTSNHTPGVWISNRDSNRLTRILAVHKDFPDVETVDVAMLFHNCYQEANARLIAEAPAMLEALKALTHPDGLSSANIRRNLDSARAILDHIEGRL